MAEQTVNVPQLILILVLGGLAIRYFFFAPGSTSSSQNRNATSANNVRAREADVERIQQMFPQVSRRSIMWDLQRNGGNVVATTERILSGRGLEVVSPAGNSSVWAPDLPGWAWALPAWDLSGFGAVRQLSTTTFRG